MAWMETSGPRMLRAGVPESHVARRQAPKYMQYKRGRVEQSGEPQD
jgi:hypothetical protein